ncbi:MAG: DUF2723 domain-containing protein, partial [candidate division WOR-3 bacterium]
LTACRDIFWADTTEFMLCGRFLYLPHPPGYPLLTLVLRTVSLIPVLTMPFRMNLVSSLAAAGSCLFVFLAVRQLTRDQLAGLFAALAWGFSFELWSQATVLEAYSFNVLLISAALYAVLPWAEWGQAGSLFVAAFVFGLGLANHLTTMFWLPGLLIIAWARRPRDLGLRGLAACMTLLALGPLLYLTLPLLGRSGTLASWGGITDLETLFEFVSGRTYQYRLGAGVSGYLGRQLAVLPQLLGKQFLALWVLIIPGVAFCLKKNRRLGVAMLLSFVLVSGFAAAYNIPDKEGFFLPAYFAAVVVLGCGFALVRRKHSAAAVVGFLLLILPLAFFYRQHDRSELHGLRVLSESLRNEVPEGSVLFTDDYSTTRGMEWLVAETGNDPVLVVCEYLLVFPWYLQAVNAHAPVPERAFMLASRLWQTRVRALEFGDLARNTTQEVKHLLIQQWISDRPLFWLPADFQTWAESWREFPLELHGLTYRLLSPGTKPKPADSIRLVFPGPDRYNTDRFLDVETQDLCRRFAAAANRRGILRFSTGDSKGALSDFNLALAYFPAYPSPVENKGIVYFYSDQADSAKYYLSAYLEIAPDNQEVIKVRSFLNRLEQQTGKNSSPGSRF